MTGIDFSRFYEPKGSVSYRFAANMTVTKRTQSVNDAIRITGKRLSRRCGVGL
jgi:hypothetical protein